METEKTPVTLPLSGPGGLDPEQTFTCGQCFRWRREGERWLGVVRGRAAVLELRGETAVLRCAPGEEELWRDYFDQGEDYAALRRRVSVNDYFRRAAEHGSGIRLLRQEAWETLVTFILSQCSSIPRIRGNVEALCARWGEPVTFGGAEYRAFPRAEALARLTPEELAPLRCGYRAPYLTAAARAVASGALELEALKGETPERAMAALRALPGVGEKVASCVLLFGLGFRSAFPVDTWVRKALRENCPPDFDPRSFGEDAGAAQQYMFFYQRQRAGSSGPQP